MKTIHDYHADCYVLCENRTNAFIHNFLDTFLPNRKESADAYEVPQYADKPQVIFKTAQELIDYMALNKNEIHSIYWSNTDDAPIKGAMCFFTNSGHLILGLYCETMFPDTTIEEKVFNDLKEFAGNSNGYIAYEEPAAHDENEFLERVRIQNKV